MSRRLQGLYAITDSVLAQGSTLAEQVTQALQGGARVIQFRDKGSDPTSRERDGRLLLQICRSYGAPLIINDDLDLAARIGADGVHLGRDDPQLLTARERLGSEAIIGVSCYNQLELAVAAEQSGASYVAFGRFFPSGSKPDATPADIATLEQARRRLHIPIVAIGGITPENGPPLIRAGASMLAVIHAVFGQSDIRAACHRFTQLFPQSEDPLS